MTKTCSKCQKTKDISLFYKRTPALDYYCKDCRNNASHKTWSTNKKKCSTQDCDKPHYARTVCKCCYHKLLKREKKNK